MSKALVKALIFALMCLPALAQRTDLSRVYGKLPVTNLITGTPVALNCVSISADGLTFTTVSCGAGGGGTWGSITGTLSSQTDLNSALNLKAPLASPTFTGTPAAPTAAVDTNTTQLATSAFVLGQAASANPVINGTAAPGTSTRYARGDHVHPTDTTRAALASPTFTGVPAAPTAAPGTNTTQLATTAFVGTAVTTSSSLSYIRAVDYGVKANTRFVWTATCTNGSSTCTCPSNDCNFVSGDVGKIVFATNAQKQGYQSLLTSTVCIPQGTITTVNSAQSITVSTTGNANCPSAGNTVLIWGDDDSAALANAWAATKAACSTLQLPGLNQQGNGPGAMLVQSAQFNTALINCTANTGGSRQGLGVWGTDFGSTIIIPTPNFNPATCTFGPSTHGCFFTIPDGMDIRDLTIWGAGISNPGTTFNTAVIVDVEPANNGYLRHVNLIGWGAAASTSGIAIGFQLGGNDLLTEGISVDGAGGVGIKTMPAASAGNSIRMIGTHVWDTAYTNLWVTSTQPTVSVAGFYGNGQAMVAVTGGGLFYGIGDIMGAGVSTSSSAVYVGYASGVNGAVTTSAGTAFIQGADIEILGGAGGKAAYINASTDKLYLVNSILKDSTSGHFSISNNGGSFYDQGGNSFNAVNKYTGTGNVWGSNSISGTAQTSGNWSVPAGASAGQWGTSPSVGSCSGDARLQQCTITVGSGTVGTNPILTMTHPNSFLSAPICNATQVGGTQAMGAYSTGTVSTTSAAFTAATTPTASNTIILQVQCSN